MFRITVTLEEGIAMKEPQVTYEVKGLEDFQPHAFACRACTGYVLARVHNAYANLSLDHFDCELHYEGICQDAV